MATPEPDMKAAVIEDYKRKLLQHKEFDSKVRTLREEVKKSKGEYDKTEDDLKALQSVGQIIGEVLRQLDDERCKLCFFDGKQVGDLLPFSACPCGPAAHQHTT